MKGEWLRYCGTVGKPDGNREDKYQPEVLRESGLLTAAARQCRVILQVRILRRGGRKGVGSLLLTAKPHI